ncbi:zinc finger protein 600-like [Nylanderia fulva]|uniref:zinc finger protein 600-like n=1 Tax=Nylanderia fulva TaxID=613905 RepID=UPI0010FB2AC2|nr:zinc finger protein 600-like [Nylanderia fulva]XP_029172066.1 zinc finger protein 600-like [Nylanderia fulva]
MRSSDELESDQQNNENTEDECADSYTQTEKSNNNKQKDDETENEASDSSMQTSTSNKGEYIQRKRKLSESSADLEENVEQSRIVSSERIYLRKVNEGDFACHICTRRFKTNVRLEKHLRRHNKDRVYLCDKCAKTFTTNKYLQMHMREMHGNNTRYPCEICNKTFSRKESLNSHMLTHTDYKAICPECNKTFKYRATMLRHYKNAHSTKPYLRQNFEVDIEVSSYGSARTRGFLPGSGRVERTLEPYSTGISGPQSYMFNDSVQESMRKEYDKSRKCELCEKYFSSKYSLKKHYRTVHSTEKPHLCQHCGASFRLKGELDNHKQYCKDLQTSTSRKAHLRDCEDNNGKSKGKGKDDGNSEKMSYKCECGCSFKTQNQLDNHRSSSPYATCHPDNTDSD